MGSLRVGDKAPDFTLYRSAKNTVNLYRILGEQGKKVIVYFYPKDFTPGCTKEACGFGEMYADLQSRDYEILGISPDSIESHKRFAEENHIPFTLLSDPDKKVAEAYGVKGAFGLMNKRITFVIDGEGTVQRIVESMGAGKHLDAIRSIINQGRQQQ